jgi:traG-related protein
MIDIANDDRHGYCQYAGFPMGNGIVSTGRYFNPDVDCSSFVYYALKNTGYDIGNTVFATGGMETALTRAGFHKIPYSNSGLIEGDILWNPNHTEVYIGNGMTVGAHSSETGGINGRPGDQTGEEVSVASNSNSWIFVYRK